METTLDFTRKTRSLCPVCLEEIDARLFARGGQIRIDKTCPRHGDHDALVEPDAGLYLRCMAPAGRPRTVEATAIPVSFRCNLDCVWCYLPERGQEFEPTREEVLDIVARCGSPHIVLSGGEPTLREDLPDLIRLVRQRFPDRVPALLTNGLKLADPDYLPRVREAGLDIVTFSLNGFRPATDEFFFGRDLTRQKLAALENLRRLGVPTVLSTTLARGVNEDEFPEIYRYALRNIDFVRALRVRNVTDLGNYAERPHLYLSDLLGVLAAATGFSLAEMCLINDVVHRRTKTGNRFSFSIFPALEQRRRKAVGEALRANPGGTIAAHRQEIRELLRADVRRLIGDENARRMEAEPAGALMPIRDFAIEVFSWPTAATIDLNECRQSSINHVSQDGIILPFQEAMFHNERLRLKAPPRA